MPGSSIGAYCRPMGTLHLEPTSHVCSMHSLSTELPSPWSLAGVWPICASEYLLDTLPRHSLELLRVGTAGPSQQLSNQVVHLRPLMEAIGATSAIVGLAIPVFKSAKDLRDRIKLVRYPPYPLVPSGRSSSFSIRVLRSHRKKRNF